MSCRGSHTYRRYNIVTKTDATTVASYTRRNFSFNKIFSYKFVHMCYKILVCVLKETWEEYNSLSALEKYTIIFCYSQLYQRMWRLGSSVSKIYLSKRLKLKPVRVLWDKIYSMFIHEYFSWHSHLALLLLDFGTLRLYRKIRNLPNISLFSAASLRWISGSTASISLFLALQSFHFNIGHLTSLFPRRSSSITCLTKDLYLRQS